MALYFLVQPLLLPKNQPLDLFVTVTDFNGHDQVLRLNSPEEVTESEHRITVDFSTRGRTGLAEIAELIFAARATASFPGAFPPFSVRELDRLLTRENVTWPGRSARCAVTHRGRLSCYSMGYALLKTQWLSA